MKKFSIIIPTLNEAGNIQDLFHRISETLRTANIAAEIIVVDDGSTDGTRQFVTEYRGPLTVRLLCRDSERGLTGAVVAGAKAASYDHLVVMDGDLSHPPELIPELVLPLMAGQYDMVLGSRYTSGGTTPNWPMTRRISSFFASIPAQLLTSVHDPLSGFFAVRTDLVRRIDKNLEGFKVGLEILATENSLHVGEVPILFQDRSNGSSKMNGTVCREYLQQLTRLSVERYMNGKAVTFFLLGLVAGLLDFSIFSLCRSTGGLVGLSHLVSFLLAMHGTYGIAMLAPHWKSRLADLSSYVRFIIVILMIMFLRGGIIAFPLFGNGSLSHVVPWLVFATGCMSWMAASVLVQLKPFRLRPVNWQVLGPVLIGYAILLRFIYAGNIELMQEEAYYWNYSQHLAAGYLDHPPMVALLIRFGTFLFGNNEFGVRQGPLLCWFISAFFSYRLTTTIFDTTAALKAVVLMAILPIFFGVGLFSTPDAPLVACWAASLYYLYRALVLNEKSAWYRAGIWLGLGLFSKYTIAFLGFAVVVYMLASRSGRKWLFRVQPYLAAVIALAIFSPVIFWNYEHHWASFLFQSQGRIQATPEFSTPFLVLSALILLTPTGLLSALYSLLPRFAAKNDATPEQQDIYSKAHFFLAMMTIAPLAIFVLFSFTKEVKLNWIGPLWLAIIPLIAFNIGNYREGVGRKLNRFWPATLVVTALLFGGLLHYCTFGVQGASFGRSVFLFGWDDLAQKVDKLADKTPLPAVVVGVDSYRTASGLTFYRNKSYYSKYLRSTLEQTTGRQLFGENALMYDYWFSPEQALNHDLIVIADKKEKLAPAIFSNHYRHLGDIHELSVQKRGKDAGRFFYRILSSYLTDKKHLNTSLTSSQQSVNSKTVSHDS